MGIRTRQAVFVSAMLVVASGPARLAAAPPEIRISEIHYDNSGTDVGEAIEVSGPAGHLAHAATTLRVVRLEIDLLVRAGRLSAVDAAPLRTPLTRLIQSLSA